MFYFNCNRGQARQQIILLQVNWQNYVKITISKLAFSNLVVILHIWNIEIPSAFKNKMVQLFSNLSHKMKKMSNTLIILYLLL